MRLAPKRRFRCGRWPFSLELANHVFGHHVALTAVAMAQITIFSYVEGVASDKLL
jgi:hypothetical protein